MRTSRILALAAGCATILAVGYVLAPEPPPTLELVTPVTSTASGEASS